MRRIVFSTTLDPAGGVRVSLEPRGVETCPTTGLVLLSYDVA